MGGEAERHEAVWLLKHFSTATVLEKPLGSRHNNVRGLKCFAWPCFHNSSSCKGGSRLVSYALQSLQNPGDLRSFSPSHSFTQHCPFCLFFCQQSRPIDGRCDWWGGALTDSPKACIVFVILIPKNSHLKRQPKCFFHFYFPMTQTSQYTYYTNILHLCIGSCEIRDNILI